MTCNALYRGYRIYAVGARSTLTHTLNWFAPPGKRARSELRRAMGRLGMPLAASVLLCAASLVAPQGGSAAVFQDEVRPAAERDAPTSRTIALADFQDSVWQAGRQQGANEPKNVLYREPFVLDSDDEIRSTIDAAHDRVLVKLKEADKSHDGVLRTHNVRDVLTLALNPDGAPLSPDEEEMMSSLLDSHLRKQGFVLPGQVLKRPISRPVLQSWPSIFFFRDAAPALKLRRQQVQEAKLAQEEQDRLDSERRRAENAAAEASGQRSAPVSVDLAAGDDPFLRLLSVSGDEEAARHLGGA